MATNNDSNYLEVRNLVKWFGNDRAVGLLAAVVASYTVPVDHRLDLACVRETAHWSVPWLDF